MSQKNSRQQQSILQRLTPILSGSGVSKARFQTRFPHYRLTAFDDDLWKQKNPASEEAG